MRNSLRVAFDSSGYSLESFVVQGFDCSAQNFLVALGTLVGTDLVFPDKGTDLRQKLLSGAIYDEVQAAQMSSIGAAEIQFMLVSNDTVAEKNDAVADSTFVPSEVINRAVILRGTLTSYGGVTTPIVTSI